MPEEPSYVQHQIDTRLDHQSQTLTMADLELAESLASVPNSIRIALPNNISRLLHLLPRSCPLSHAFGVQSIASGRTIK
ncbi:MAG: hypothetical protein CM1200mP24_07180 [Gammaproteobacteria bacterium]|nr:MAG: hypothetical protein CM1200mP24_07180 [Gammaproteobacteria bacterium]